MNEEKKTILNKREIESKFEEYLKKESKERFYLRKKPDIKRLTKSYLRNARHNLLATDDDNVRKKKDILDIKVIGTPAIILKLYNKEIVNKEKTLLSIENLREIGWFSNALLDAMIMEVNKK